MNCVQKVCILFMLLIVASSSQVLEGQYHSSNNYSSFGVQTYQAKEEFSDSLITKYKWPGNKNVWKQSGINQDKLCLAISMPLLKRNNPA